MEEKKTSYVNNPADGELHPVLLVREIFRKLWAIVMVAVIAASLAYVGASLLYKPQYQTRTTFVVSVRDGSSTVYSNLNAAKSMASTFSEVLNSDVLKKRIAPAEFTGAVGTVGLCRTSSVMFFKTTEASSS